MARVIYIVLKYDKEPIKGGCVEILIHTVFGEFRMKTQLRNIIGLPLYYTHNCVENLQLLVTKTLSSWTFTFR
jgi:hypothetical protein